MIYPIFIFKTDHGFDGYFPGIEGCFFASDTLVGVSRDAEEAFAVHMEALIEEGYPFPAPPKDAQCYLGDARLAEENGILGFVDIDPTKYERKSVKLISPCRRICSRPLTGILPPVAITRVVASFCLNWRERKLLSDGFPFVDRAANPCGIG